MGFQKAVKSQAKLRAALFGPSGAGKTLSAILIGLGILSPKGRLALIDSEHGSASKYAEHELLKGASFDVLDLEEKNIDEYVAAIAEAGKAGYEVLIIDSLSHGWQQLLEEVDKLANAKFRGNSWSAWSEGTPKQRELVDAILSFPGHIIATMRSKTEWQTTKDDRGKSAPVRVGLAPEQGKGIEYEFDLLLEISTEHIANVIKDRTGKFQDKLIEKPGKEFGAQLVAWLSEGAAPIPRPSPAAPLAGLTPEEYTAARDELQGLITELGTTMTQSVGCVAAFDEPRRVVYREKKAALGLKERGIGALPGMRALVAEAKKELEDLRAAWEAAGSPKPRPAVLPSPAPKPQAAPTPEAPVEAAPASSSTLSPAAQKVAAAAGVSVGETPPAAEPALADVAEEELF